MTNKFAAVAQEVASQVNIEESVTKGGGNFVNPLIESAEAGDVALVRFVSYIEVGDHETKGKYAKVVPQVMLGFEVVTPKHTKTGDDGKLITGSVSVTIPVGNNEKSKYVKYFRAMNYAQKHKHFAEMLGQAFLVPNLLVNESGDKKYVNLHSQDLGVQLAAPLQKDPMTGTTAPIAAPEATRELQCFIFNNPTDEQWDSIFIDGEKDDGSSKNWIQDKIKSCLNFQGSPVQQYLASKGVELPDPAAKAEHKPANGADASDALNQL